MAAPLFFLEQYYMSDDFCCKKSNGAVIIVKEKYVHAPGFLCMLKHTDGKKYGKITVSEIKSGKAQRETGRKRKEYYC